MSRRPRQVADKAQTMTVTGAAFTSTQSPSEAAPAADVHVQVTGSNTSAAGTSETLPTPTEQMEHTAVSGAGYTSS